jgi:hypothetical protein
MTLSSQLEQRQLSELVHFTTQRGVVGTLAKGALLSRHRLPQEEYLQYVLHVNAARRPEADAFFDKSENWLDYVNLSLTEINTRYFRSSRNWHLGNDIWWAILAFDAKLILDEGVVFATTNKAMSRDLLKS